MKVNPFDYAGKTTAQQSAGDAEMRESVNTMMSQISASGLKIKQSGELAPVAQGSSNAPKIVLK